MITVMSYCSPIERGLYSIVHTFLECPTCSGKYAQLTYLTNDMTHAIPHQQERLLHRTLVLIIINTLVCMSNCYISIKTDLQTGNIMTSLYITCQVTGRPLQILNKNSFSSSVSKHPGDKTRLLTVFPALN